MIILANMGVPMLPVQGTFMIATLIPIILIEALVVRRTLSVGWKRSFAGSAAGNVVSTIAGVPLSWGLMFLVMLAGNWIDIHLCYLVENCIGLLRHLLALYRKPFLTGFGIATSPEDRSYRGWEHTACPAWSQKPPRLKITGTRPFVCKPYIEMRKTQHWQPKHDKEIKWVPMSAAVHEILKRRQAQYKDGLLFRNSTGKEARGDKTRESLQRMFSKVNIDSTTRRLHWHSFRAFFVRKCVRKGIPINAIMRMTGHDSIGLVLHYADADKAAVLQETDKLFAPCGRFAEVTSAQ